MSVNIRYPNITGRTEKEQLNQIKSYLHQLVEHLNIALPNLGSGSGTTQSVEVQGSEMSYYELRSLIIQELNEVQKMVDQLDTNYVKNGGWTKGSQLVTNASGNVVAGKLILDEDGTLYYEVEE